MKFCLLIIGLCVALLWGSGLKAQKAGVIADAPLLYTTEYLENKPSIPDDTTYTIKEITVSGNKRTRKLTVLRELSFKSGEAYPFSEITKKVEETKRQLMNTNLFRRVVVSLRSLEEQQLSIHVDVEEKWYFLPQPFIRLANGTFSQWNERGRKLEHLNYGVKLTQFNFSGRGDKMHVHLTNGYTKKFALQYQGFYLDKKMKWSSNINFAHGKNRELNYATENNKLLPIKNPDGYLYEFTQSSIDVTYRPAIKTRHTFSVGFNYNKIADTITKLNAFYAPSGSTYSFPYLNYTVSFQDLDFNPYPTKGRRGDISLHKAGINSSFNLWQLSVKGTNYWTVSPKTYFSLNAGGVLKLPFKQPYITQGFLGHGDAYLQGYENYFVDGVAGGYTKATIGYRVLKTEIPLPTNKWFKSLRSVPLQLYVKSYGNAGYAYNPNFTRYNELNNKMLYSGGVGLDIVAFTDLIFKFEWSFNQLGQNGLYLHQ